MHHQRVQQEKKKLNFDLEKLRNNHIVFEKKYDEQADKYSHLMKEKMLIKLERDRLKTRAHIQKEINQSTPASVVSET
jgi:sperm-associated antigen 16 protein